MRLCNLLDGTFPKPPFSLLGVPPLRHALEETGSEIRPREYDILSPGVIVFYGSIEV